MRLDVSLPIPRAFVGVALLAWGATFVGLVRSVITGFVVTMCTAPG